MYRHLVIFCIGLSTGLLHAQGDDIADLRAHVDYLADDRLEGRLTGTEGERLAFEYITRQFETLGLEPVGEEGYLQAFDFSLGQELDGENALQLDQMSMSPGSGYSVLPWSGPGSADGELIRIETVEDLTSLQAAGAPVAVDMTVFLDGPVHPHAEIDVPSALSDLADRGAGAVLFFKTDGMLPDPLTDLTRRVETADLPAIFVQDATALQDGANTDLVVGLRSIAGVGHNVVGVLDNGADHTVVLGAHYDHLGHGQYGGSLYRGDEVLIHNGADDNASGVAMILELADRFRTDPPVDANILLIAFSGEELGLFGSAYFTENPLIDLETVRFMFNFDMVGSLDTADLSLALNGTGTSPVFGELIPALDARGMDLKPSESGVGPSDHTQFYLEDIPVLHFFTGTTPHYHRPTDDPHRLNYEGMGRILDFAGSFIDTLCTLPEIPFTKTKDADSRKAPSFSVTLGVVPDYMYSDGGMRIDGVTDGKPADSAGLQAGDVVVGMGEVEVTDMMTYMKGLAQFAPGDRTVVTILRDGVEQEVEVQF